MGLMGKWHTSDDGQLTANERGRAKVGKMGGGQRKVLLGGGEGTLQRWQSGWLGLDGDTGDCSWC
jgi:hypothetical protein